jgi:hypothetical protein
MTTNTPFRFVVATLLLAALGCNLPFGFEDNDEEWNEPASETNAEEYTMEDDDGEEMLDDDPAPVINDDVLFLRDFSFELPLFSPDSAWNQRADSAAVLPESDAQILSLYRVLLGDISSLKGYDEPATDWPYMDVSLYDFTIPIFRTGDEMQEVWICQDDGVVGWAHAKFGIETEGGPVIVPAPAGKVRPAGPEDDGADGWLVLYDPETFTSYDYFAAKPFYDEDCYGFEGGLVGEKILQAGVVDFFDIRGPGVNQPGDGSYSARAVGTPLLAGMILPEDIENGAIAHALSFAIPGPRNTSPFPENPSESDYFYPASTTETDFYNTDSDALASGQRIRLKQTIVDEGGQVIDESELAPITRMYLTALREYGAYLVDNAGGFTFYAEDVHTAVLNLSDDEVNALIGEPAGTPFPENMTKWQVVMEALGNDLGLIPLAVSPGDDEPHPKTAEIEAANFEVVEPAKIPK